MPKEINATENNYPEYNICNTNVLQFHSRILAIDPSGTGTSGFCLAKDGIIEFRQFKSSYWKKHLEFIIKLVKEEEIDTIIYEHTNYINCLGKDMTFLLKLFGGIETLQYTFALEIYNLPADQIKKWGREIKTKTELIPNLEPVGKSNRWTYQAKKISKHQLDALLVYLLWLKKY